MADFKRTTAEILKITDLINGKFIKSSGEFEPSYVSVNGKDIGRVNLMGIVVDISELGDSFSLDDGTSLIDIKSFDNNSNAEVAIGEMVNVIGKPREFDNQIFIVREIVKKTNGNWLELRRKEIASQSFAKSENIIKTTKDPVKEEPFKVKEKTVDPEIVTEKLQVKQEVVAQPEVKTNLTPFGKILKMIKDSDGGEGADFEEVVEKSGVDGAEEIINQLLEEGEIFEVKSGRLKILE